MKRAAIVGLGQLSRIQLIKELLQEKYEVKIFIHDYDHAKKQYKKNREPQYIYLHMPAFKKNISLSRVRAYYVWGNNVSKALNEFNPDLIYVIFPPNYLAYKCMCYCKKNKETVLVEDVYNLWPEAMPIAKYENKYKWAFRKWRSLRSASLEKAKLIFSECDYYYDFIINEVGKDSITETLYLYKEQSGEERGLVIEKLDEIKRDREKEFKEYGEIKKLKIGYLGGINNIIDLQGITDITSELVKAGFSLEIRIIGVGEKKNNLITALEMAGANVIYYGPIYENKKKIVILGECDFCFNMMKDNVVVGLTTKSTDYLSMGIPIINNIKGDTWKAVEEHQIGFNYTGTNGKQLIDFIKTNQTIGLRYSALEFFDQNLTYEVVRKKARESLMKAGII